MRIHLSKLIIFIALAITYNAAPALAHPGNVASDGGHYCRTNCEYWGYEYDVRHFHGTYTPTRVTPSYYEQGQTNGYNNADTAHRTYIESSAKTEGENDGATDAYNASISPVHSATSTICEKEPNFSAPQDPSYVTSYRDSYTMKCKEIYNVAYATAYDATYDSTKTKILADIAKEKEENAEQNAAFSDTFASLLVVSTLSIPLFLGLRSFFKK